MVTKWKDSPELAPEKMAVLYVREKSAFEGLEATDGETADIGEIVFIEARPN
jgi:hypothetical protein